MFLVRRAIIELWLIITSPQIERTDQARRRRSIVLRGFAMIPCLSTSRENAVHAQHREQRDDSSDGERNEQNPVRLT